MIVKEEFSIRRAARVFNIPRTTLATYLKTATSNTKKNNTMRPEEQDFLMQWMTDCCQRGFSIKKRNVITAVEHVIKQSGEPRPHPFMHHKQYQKFLRRWVSVDKVKERKHIGIVPDWFSHIESYLGEGNYLEILNHPDRIFLCDEFKFKERLDISENIACALRETNILYTVTATGNALQPLIVYPYKGEIPQHIIKAAPKNCAVVPQQQGIITPKIFNAYLKRVLHAYIEQSNIPTPVIVFIDESMIDLTVELTTACKNLGIVLLGLTCQVLKPTINLFSNLVDGWTEEVRNYCQSTGREFTIVECADMMQKVNQKCIHHVTIAKDFGECSLYPWNKSVGTTSHGPIISMEYNEDDLEIEKFLEDVDEDSDDEDFSLAEIPEEVEASQTPEENQHKEKETSAILPNETTLDNQSIRLKYGDFKNLLGADLMEQCKLNYAGKHNVSFSNNAEQAIFEIYRKFHSAHDMTVVEVVEIGDD
ncbi:uncharacterized protein LOC129773916 isoform X2 [Toxorhynchites rutilus septentrionalis]|nr:uncharacterized protein LOC129773916 isoform X2 [Toxorhynchites rutilus septentrionalis]